MSLEDHIEQELKKIQNKIKPPSVLVTGRTGAGKSSVINAVFGAEMAPVGAGLPVTKYYQRYPDSTHYMAEKPPVIIYDSPGFEAEKAEEYIRDTVEFLTFRAVLNQKDEDKKIHVIWHFIHAAGARFETLDKKVIETADALGIPVIVVLSQCDIARPREISKLEEVLSSELRLENNMLKGIIKVAADPINGEPFGLNFLVNKTIDAIPATYTEAFIIAQQVNLKAKRKVASSLIAAAATVCFTVGLVPIPGTTPLTLIGSQTGFLLGLIRIYNLQKYVTPKIIAGTFTVTTVLTLIGTAIADSVFMLGGGAIAGGLAATYIVIFGLACISTFEILIKNYLNSNTNSQHIESFFKENFREQFRKYAREVKITTKSDIEKTLGAAINRPE